MFVMFVKFTDDYCNTIIIREFEHTISSSMTVVP